MTKSIFLHSLFRTGSTYLFNKFRSNVNTWVYYEPLHHDLVRLKRGQLTIWRYDKKATYRMNHPELDNPHFYEYHNAFGDEELLPYFNASFAYEDYQTPPAALKNYLDNLLKTSPDSALPVLQFNRSSLRLDWFKQNYFNALHLYLLRNPVDQFESYVRRGPQGKNVFLAINLIILSKNPEIFNGIERLPELEGQYETEQLISRAMLLCRKYTDVEHFRFFMNIWAKSICMALETSIPIIDMDLIGASECYKKRVQQTLSEYSNDASIEFDDFSIKKHTSLTLNKKQYVEGLSEVKNYSENMQLTNAGYVESYISALQSNIYESLFKRYSRLISAKLSL